MKFLFDIFPVLLFFVAFKFWGIYTATAVAIGNVYSPDNRTLAANVSKLGIQLAVDMVGNVLKEFSPDLSRRFSRRKGKTPEP